MQHWALILGGSSGFGLATAKKLAATGMALAVVFRERKGQARALEPVWEKLREYGRPVLTFNANALQEATMSMVLDGMQQTGVKGKVYLLLHSIAQGHLKPLAGLPEERLTPEDFQITIEAMGTSWLSWANALIDRDMLADKARLLALTSEGSHRAGQHYAAVGAAKAVLEALCRSMARELGPHGIRTNLINAGVTITPALQQIPGYEKMVEVAKQKNPLGRLTTPEDVANVVALLLKEEADWINGAIIRVDGGEQIVGW